MGFSRARSLWQMRRSLYAPLPDAGACPTASRVRTFVPGAGRRRPGWPSTPRAFAHHPEQGRWTAGGPATTGSPSPGSTPPASSCARAAGTAGERLVGFHWTKVHGGRAGQAGPEPAHGHGHDRIGEVYVVGVDPAEQGAGLGRALTLVGLAHLRAAGLAEAMLYVEEDNIPAIRLYTDLGFTRWDTDVMFTAP